MKIILILLLSILPLMSWGQLISKDLIKGSVTKSVTTRRGNVLKNDLRENNPTTILYADDAFIINDHYFVMINLKKISNTRWYNTRKTILFSAEHHTDRGYTYIIRLYMNPDTNKLYKISIIGRNIVVSHYIDFYKNI